MRISNDLKGVNNVKTLGNSKRRSIPTGNSSSTYLEKYMLGKEKERLLKEFDKLEMRRNHIIQRLKDIDKVLGKSPGIEKKSLKSKYKHSFEEKKSSDEGNEKKEWKKMSLTY